MARFSAPVVFLLVVVLTVALKKANGDAATNQKIEEAMSAIVGDCLKEHSVKVEEPVKVSHINSNLDNIEPCFFQCLFQGIGSLDDKGNLKRDVLLGFGKGILTNAGDAEKIEAIGNACLKDTNYDCVTLKELMFCMLEEKDKVGL